MGSVGRLAHRRFFFLRWVDFDYLKTSLLLANSLVIVGLTLRKDSKSSSSSKLFMSGAVHEHLYSLKMISLSKFGKKKFESSIRIMCNFKLWSSTCGNWFCSHGLETRMPM